MKSGHLSADRIGGLVWLIFGAAVAYGSWTMDRLAELHVHPATVPGLVPGLLGAGFMILGAILLVRGEHKSAAEASFLPAAEHEAVAAADAPDELAWRRLLLSWVLCVTYGGLLLGHGLPYWVLTAGFLFVHMMLLDETERVPARPEMRRLILAAILAPTVAIAVAQLFERVFLVRLP
jgi:putative tricarboxylic transport membrane protein